MYKYLIMCIVILSSCTLPADRIVPAYNLPDKATLHVVCTISTGVDLYIATSDGKPLLALPDIGVYSVGIAPGEYLLELRTFGAAAAYPVIVSASSGGHIYLRTRNLFLGPGLYLDRISSVDFELLKARYKS
jgi:hypothetical protein